MVELIAATSCGSASCWRCGGARSIWRSERWRFASRCTRASSSDRRRTSRGRTIPLGPHAINTLKEHRDRSARNGEDDLVFPNKSGEPRRESKLLERVLQPTAERAAPRARDVACVPPHSLVAAQRSPRAGQDRAGAARTREPRRRSTSTRTSSMRRTARRSKRSKSGCLANRTQTDVSYRRAPIRRTRKRQCSLMLEWRRRPEPGVEVLQIS
jgi:hypothetical protein